MALSMQERRILAQIEVRLSEDDPRLARRLAAHGRERRPRRTRVIAAVAVALIGVLGAIAAAAVTAFS
jgi:hypothetical protein